MSIRDIQIENTLKKIVYEFIKDGKHPRLREAINKADLSRLGLPSKYERIADVDSLIRSDYINEAISNYETDFEVLDQAIAEYEQWVSTKENEFWGRFQAAQKLYEKLALKVSALANAIKSGSKSVISITESFTDLNYIDLERTDAYIDTDNGRVTLPIVPTTLIDYSLGHGISLMSSEKSVNGSSWTTISTGPNRIDPVIEFPSYKGQLFARYILSFTAPRPEWDDETVVRSLEFDVPKFRNLSTRVKIRTSYDFQNWTDWYITDNAEKICFAPDDVFQFVEIILEKDSYDSEHVNSEGKITYLYLPYLENILARVLAYQSEASLYTKAYSIPYTAQYMGLSTMKFIPNITTNGNTSIDFFYSFDGNGWNELKPNSTIQLARVFTKNEVLYPIFPKKGPDGTVKIWEDLHQVSDATLYEGYAQFEHQWLPYSPNYMTLSGWAEYSNIYKIPTQFENIKDISALSSSEVHKLYTRIRTDSEQQLSVRSLALKRQSDQANVDSDLKIYINNQEITAKKYADLTYSFNATLLPGDNYVNILIKPNEDSILLIDSNIYTIGIIYTNRYILTSLENTLTYTTDLLPFIPVYKFTITYNGNLLINRFPYPNVKYLLSYTDIENTVPSEIYIRADLHGDDMNTPIIEDIIMNITEPIKW